MSAPARVEGLRFETEVRRLVDELTSPAMPSAQAIAGAGLEPVIGLAFRVARWSVRVLRHAVLGCVRGALAIYVAGRRAVRHGQ